MNELVDEIFYMSFTTNRDPMNALNRDFLKRTLFQIGYYANTKILKLIHADKADKIIGHCFKVDIILSFPYIYTGYYKWNTSRCLLFKKWTSAVVCLLGARFSSSTSLIFRLVLFLEFSTLLIKGHILYWPIFKRSQAKKVSSSNKRSYF